MANISLAKSQSVDHFILFDKLTKKIDPRTIRSDNQPIYQFDRSTDKLDHFSCKSWLIIILKAFTIKVYELLTDVRKISLESLTPNLNS